MTFIIANSHRNISQQLSRPSIGLGKPSLANKLRYTGPIDGFPSVACFAGSTSIIYFLSSISISSSPFLYIIELKNSNNIYIYIYRLNLQQRQVEKCQSLEVEVWRRSRWSVAEEFFRFELFSGGLLEKGRRGCSGFEFNWLETTKNANEKVQMQWTLPSVSDFVRTVV